MAKVVKFPLNNSSKFGYKRVKRRKKTNLEDFGQLNLFDDSTRQEARIVQMKSHQGNFEIALMLDERNELEGAKEYYHKTIEEGESMADAYCNLGIIESEQQRFSKAIDYFTQCLKHDPRHYEAHYNLANVYSEVGNKELARLHYELVIEIEPDFANAYYNLGLVMVLENKYKEAIAVLNKYKSMLSEDHEHVDRLVASLRQSILSSHG